MSMSNIAEVDHLKLLEPGASKIIPDITIRFEGSSSDKTLVAHKYVLAQMSTVFEEQLYGTLSANAKAEGDFSGSIEVITEKEFSFETFNTFIRHIYGDKDIVRNCTSFETLFQLLQMAWLYLIDKLAELVPQRINDLPITMDILLPTLETVLAYRNLDGFGYICESVDKKMAATFSCLPMRDQHRFYKQHRQTSPQLVGALINLIADNKPAEAEAELEVCLVNKRKFYQFYQENQKDRPELVNALVDLMSDFVLEDFLELDGCKNCLMTREECKHGKLLESVPHVGLRYKAPNGSPSYVESVIHTGTTSSGQKEYDIKQRTDVRGQIYKCKYPNDFLDGRTYLCKI